MTRGQLDKILASLSAARSLVTAERMCLGFTGGGNVPDVDRAASCELRWRGSAVPWWLAPLRFVAAANRTLFEVTEGRELPSFVGGTDLCFNVEIYSCPRALLPAVVEHLRESGVTAGPGEVIDRDPAYFELLINCDGGKHDSWLVSARCGPGCPDDLAVIARRVEDDDAPDDS
jgi:hypothetical protein